MIADPGGRLLRGWIEVGDGREIQIAFVDGYLLQIRRIPGQQLHHGPAVAAVHGVIRLLHHEAGTFPQGRGHRLGSLNPVLLRRNRLSQHDPMAALLISADNSRNGSQIYVASILQFLQGSPAQVG